MLCGQCQCMFMFRVLVVTFNFFKLHIGVGVLCSDLVHVPVSNTVSLKSAYRLIKVRLAVLQ